MVAGGWFIALVTSISERPLSPLPRVASRLPMASRWWSAIPISGRRGATAVSMNARNLGSASMRSVSGLGTRASAISSALARCAVIAAPTARRGSSSLSDIGGSLRLAGRRQADAAAERLRLRENVIRERDVVGDEAGRMAEDSLVGACAAGLRASGNLLDFRMHAGAPELAFLHHRGEHRHAHVHFEAVEHDLVHAQPVVRVELAARQRDEGRAWFEPFRARHHLR